MNREGRPNPCERGEHMTDKLIDELLARWDAVVAKLTELSPKVFGLYLRQAVLVDGVVTVLVSTVVLCITVYCLPKAVANYKWAAEECSIWEADLGWAFAVVGLVVLGCFAIGFFISGVAHLINPEYYALRALIRTFVK